MRDAALATRREMGEKILTTADLRRAFSRRKREEQANVEINETLKLVAY